MHIPDGYLSPSTCAALFAGAAPFWVVALRRLEREFRAKLVPLLSLVSAFSFVLMMFNIPLPGGTTGHAVGMALAAIVLGPWAAMLSISVALVIQAVFFGDGGITALGANCFNMAIAGSLVAFAIYRGISGNAELHSRRRIIAAGLAGYGAINVSALLTAIEFGIQPALFRDASGAPLYAPYPLHIAVPAMLIGHLSLAGIAECAVTAGVVAYVQRANPSLLQRTARTASATAITGSQGLRPLWIRLAAVMVATPLGLLAAGSAWGEWGADDFKSPAGRAEIAAVSGNAPLPEKVPAGMEQWGAFWTAPIPDYAPSFLKSSKTGYVISAIFGAGLTIFGCMAVGSVFRLAGTGKRTDNPPGR